MCGCSKSIIATQPSLTTDYTPLQRGALSGTPKATTVAQPVATATVTTSQPAALHEPQILVSSSEGQVPDQKVADGPDPSTLPPATAPPSHPKIDPSVPGTLDGRSILDVDLGAMAEKPWRRPGSDISDWFNYGFDEISWEAYCYRRRDLGELGNVLKVNVMVCFLNSHSKPLSNIHLWPQNFAGMPEDQLSALPPELRTMVMTGATAMMNNGAPNPSMMGGMNPMMDMSGMGGMNMGPMGMGMNGDMSMQMQPSVPMMQEGPGQVPGTVAAPEQGVQIGMQDGYGPGGPGPAMMGMGMGGDFGMQVCSICTSTMSH
jgi:pre-mRNA 3'-end-processing factor FIP1